MKYVLFVAIVLLIFKECGSTRARYLEAESQFPGDTYPNCVDIVSVDPPPNSYLVDGNVSFFVTFSRAVERPIVRYRYTNGTRQVIPECFLTPSRTELQEISPIESVFVGTSRTKRKYSFSLTMDAMRIYKMLYLVFDGGQYLAFGGKWSSFVPASIFGKYYTDSTAVRTSDGQFHFAPSVYCGLQLMRPLPEPFYGNSFGEKFTVSILSDRHKLVLNTNGEYELRMSAIMSGTGNQTLSLPRTLKATYKGINFTVAIPRGTNVEFSQLDLWYKIPVKTKIVHELRERIYHTSVPKVVKNVPYIPKVTNQVGLLRTHNTESNFRILAHDTNVVLLSSFVSIPDSTGMFSKEAGIRTSTRINFRHNIFKGHLLQRLWDYLPKPPYSQYCSHDSVRSAGSGRQGQLFHDLEYGPFYRLLVPDFTKLGDWSANSNSRILVQSKGINDFLSQYSNWSYLDVTSSVTFGGPNFSRTRAPMSLLDVTKKYVALVRPLSERRNREVIIALDGAIFIPRSEFHRDCNGILQYLNTERRKIANFCDKPYANCIGIPFISTKRFPVMSPFGIPEFAGWTSNRSKMANFLFGKAVHPMSRHFSEDITVPRALYYSLNGRRFMYLTAPDNPKSFVADIPIAGVQLLEPDLKLWSPSICKRIWQIKKSLKTQTSLIASLFNFGEGGVDVTLQVRCSSYLSIIPMSGHQKTVWSAPKTNTTVQFLLDSTNSITNSFQLHKCQMDIRVHLPSNFINRFLTCSKIIETYSGLFEDPCKMETTELPLMSLKYFNLPPDQYRSSTVAAVNSILSLDNSLVFIKSITISFTVPQQQEHLITNLQELKVHCRHPDVFAAEEQDFIHKATLLTLGSQTAGQIKLPTAPLVFYSSLTIPMRILFLARRSWAAQEIEGFSSCTIEVWANLPHRLCVRNPTIVKKVNVPLIPSDISAIQYNQKGTFFYLEYVYGGQPDDIMIVLIICIAVIICGSLTTIIGHAIMFWLHKKLPNLKKIGTLQRQLIQAKSRDKRLWETPQMYLVTGQYGPYYTLYDFKCTDDLNTNNVKLLKVAGLLRYFEKELQIIFGHIKKVYICHETNNVWLQASSGWYLLKPENVHEEYKKSLELFYEQYGLSVYDAAMHM